MKRVLVTGAGGFVGRELVSLLARSGYCGVATGRLPPESMPAGFQAAAREEILDGKLPVEAIDVIVHLEVKHHVINPDRRAVAELDAVNIGGTRDWLDWASKRDTRRFVFASSVKAVRAQAGNTLETAAEEPADPYGRSKARAEDAVRGWAAADPRRGAVILRFAPVYGPGNTANLADFARRVLRGQRCFVGNGETRKSIVSLRNATAVIEWALRNSATGWDVYNVSDRVPPSIRELAGMIAAIARAPRPRGVPVPLAQIGALVGDVAEAILRRPATLDSRRLAAMLQNTLFPPDKLVAQGFVHPQETEDGINELVAWLTGSVNASRPGDTPRARV